jgi:legumain
MQRQVVLLVASFLLLGISLTSADHWGVLVAGSNGYYNYRHQADVCHAYQILHKNGIPDDHIIVFMYDDIAQNTQNPTKGVLVNHLDGSDVYHGVPHDYNGKDVTPQNFLNVLLGKKDEMKGIGSGKVLETGPNDNVFIFYSDHGAVGLVAFPTGVLYAKDLNQTLMQMHAENKYNQLVIYIEACESGSMLEGLLPNNVNIYGTTASNAKESSYACYYDAKRQTYVGDLYSVKWMEDSDVEQLDVETLYQQFIVTQKETNLSHVMQYGDLNLGQTHKVGEFQTAGKQLGGRQRNLFRRHYDSVRSRSDAVPTADVRLAIISQRLAAAEENSAEKQALERELAQFLNDRATIADHFQQIASRALSMNSGDYFETITKTHMKFTQHDCYKSVTQRIQEKCFDLQNELVLNKLFIMANLCEIGLYDFTINQAVDQTCHQRLHFNY